ncbi:hypothetical protein [Pectobacterium versatile]|uniref:hypothetical protein n=1 Tax=Pectobacterium versatile TaxID=2488639 RepID=UPI001CCCBEF9|nr:hypothetical protein [Pectobacterium versatile]
MAIDINSSASTQHLYQPQIDKSLNAENTISPRKVERAKDATSLVIQSGIQNLYNRSLMPDNIEAKPTLSVPSKQGGGISAERVGELVKLSENLSKEPGVNKPYCVAASAPSLIASQINITQANNKISEADKLTTESSTVNATSSSGHARAMPSVAGGADITAADAAKKVIPQLMGDLSMLEANIAIVSMLVKQAALRNQESAQFGQFAVNSAMRSGERTVGAAQQNFTGAISSSAMGITGQGATTFTSVKALKADSASIKTNVQKASTIERHANDNRSAVTTSSDSMVSGGTQPDAVVTSGMTHSRAAQLQEAAILRDKHAQITNAGHRTRSVAEYGNQVVQSGQKVTENAFNVSASRETKEAELARADQSVNNEVSNAQQQTAKKTAETETTMRQMYENILRSKNETTAAMAGR